MLKKKKNKTNFVLEHEQLYVMVLFRVQKNVSDKYKDKKVKS